MIIKTSSLLIILLIIISCTAYSDDKKHNSFDAACNLFQEALDKGYDKQGLSDFIIKQLKNRIASDDVTSTYHAVLNMQPEERYETFKQSAEHYTGRPWDCVAAKTLFK